MDNTKIDLHLCAGYDGIGRGLELAGVSPPDGTIYVEIEAFACANLVAKIEKGELGPAVCHSDLKGFPYQEVAGHVRILTAGFPCQPFSAAGKRDGVEDPRHLWPHIARGISQCRPDVVFCENVEGIISSKTADGGSVLHYVLRDLESMGYRATAGVFSAEEVGAPHRRKRVFILAHARSDERWDLCGQESREEKLHGFSNCRSQLANASSERPQRSECRRGFNQEGWEASSGQTSECGPLWPNPPGQPQHEWEEPRTTQPGLGGTTNGSSSAVDRLRLLGNGVVPQTAAKAWTVLNERLAQSGPDLI